VAATFRRVFSAAFGKSMPRRHKLTLISDSSTSQITSKDWETAIKVHAQPNLQKAIWQLINTFIPYIVLWGLMIFTIQQGYSYWITLGLVLLASGMWARIFIFLHDCGHGSFFASRKANRILGYISGIITFTPYEDWRRVHAIHHATAGNLDRRGVGDVWTMTVAEYLSASRLKRFAYRAYRNPFIMFGLGPTFIFLIAQRFTHKGARKSERDSVIITNIAALAILVLASATIGIRTYLLIQIPIMLIAGAIGVWLFYVQHQFEGVYWARHEDWDPVQAALGGSSYYKLPKVLQWFTGNIGLHHIHHLRPLVPNYNLQKCYDELSAMQNVNVLTLRKSLDSLWLKLWDEELQKMIGFGKLRASHP
jgi:omega-6 fatty acid desaturase (delta-12 desaturase)